MRTAAVIGLIAAAGALGTLASFAAADAGAAAWLDTRHDGAASTYTECEAALDAGQLDVCRIDGLESHTPTVDGTSLPECVELAKTAQARCFVTKGPDESAMVLPDGTVPTSPPPRP